MSNVDQNVVEAFGEQWSKFDHANLDNPDLQTLFHSYFSIFPWHELPPDARRLRPWMRYRSLGAFRGPTGWVSSLY